ncbi:DUF551 domain-containing protein [Citrobacter freundii]|uniref:DUF551 domain-containing protein n=1 Tax=Citrobacter freundii TaxID=546 RepID=UPI0015E901D8|nr:DUF551 domain-containing protein [Citrobacter freundii]QLX06701.1 DUF551 domain-containing protein [Citrobacter freundii]
MTTNHPAHSPVSLDRLHQIREILSKAATQSDGGNLGYAMADAVKVIDSAIAAFGAEPVALPLPVQHWEELCRQNPDMSIGDAIIRAAWWNQCAAMLQAGNSPVTPDGWIPVSDRMPETDGNYWGWWSESKRQGPVWFIKSDLQAQFQSSEITHWMPLPAAPQQEVKSALEHGMQRYAGAMQKLAEGDK